MTMMAAFGAVIERGDEHYDVFQILGLSDWRDRMSEVEAAYGGFRPEDLYPDATRSIEALRAAGYGVAIAANQPAEREGQLRASGIDVEVIAMSDDLGVWKPDPAFFGRTLELIGSPTPADVAYVGDRVDNDVLPAIAAGIRAVWIRRGPWGVIQELPDGVTPALVVSSLDELAGRIGEAGE
jgi:HAD superfamily hydrolase (TIGR01549 family)